MFTKYFGLSEQPFGTTPNPRFLFHSNSHREALASLYCEFYANRGFTALIAKPGMGKTTLLFQFLEQMRGCAKTVFLFNTFCGPDDIVSYILRDSGLEPGPTVADRYRQVNDMLAAEAKVGRPVVLIVDEAQNLSTHTLEGIRMLTNFETTRSKLIQVVLAGQPQLAQLLSKPELAQLRQRISTFCHIEPLSAIETRSYIQHRLEIAGYTGDGLFTPAAFDLIAESSSGIPRVINTLCFNTLCICRARKAAQVDEGMVSEAIDDLTLPEVQPEDITTLSVPPPAFGSLSTPKTTASLGTVLLALTIVILVGICGVSFGPRFLHSQSTGEMRARLAQPMSPTIVNAVLDQPVSKKSTRSSQLTSDVVSGSGSSGNNKQSSGNENSPIRVRISEGDTLTRITTTHLGLFNSAVLRKMQELNPKLTDPNHIEIGDTIRLPRSVITQTSESDSAGSQP